MIKEVNCLRFIFENLSNADEIPIETKLQFTAQSPQDESLLERAILVKFTAQSDDEKFKLSCVCRVIFSFNNIDEIISGNELINKYQNKAYTEMVNLTNDTLKSLNQNGIDFPEINFPLL